MSHTQEPWAAYKDGKPSMNNETSFIKSLAGDLVTYGHLSDDDARRIVTCVNACAGIPTEALEGVKNDVAPMFELLLQTAAQRDVAWEEALEIREAIKANPEESTADEVHRVVAQRDELLAIMQSMFNEHGEFECTVGTLMKARTAISKVKAA